MNTDTNTDISHLVDALLKSYTDLGSINHIDGVNLPNRQEVIELTRELLGLVFPGFHGGELLTSKNLRATTLAHVARIEQRLTEQIERSLCYACKRAPVCDESMCGDNARRCAHHLIEKLPELRRLLDTDVTAAFKGDPACYSREEVIICYPGLMAVAVQRLAHVLYEYRVPILPRIMTEHAHQMTGVDIHPGATIGEYFFIDHGTGVVIGETTVIGNNVKMYMGITLGAKSFPKDARDICGHKRHPTVEDNVVIYANATILGDVVIGEGSVVGGNTWITESVPPGTTVMLEPPKMRIHEKKA